MKLSTELKQEFQNGTHKGLLLDIYADESRIAAETARYIAAIEQFEALYGVKEIAIYSAPGRSEVGGNHTDHQHGQVLAAAINQDIIAIVAPTEDGAIKVVSDSFHLKEINIASLDKADEEAGTSEALVKGVAKRLEDEGYQIGGFEAYMTSEVIMGAGLSSSAAFEVVIGTILSGLYNEMKISPIFIAQASQYAENVYFDKPCGLMDQMASSVGSLVNIDFKDTANPVVKKVAVDFDSFKHSLCIVDTKGSHVDLTPEYAAIPAEMKSVAEFFGKEVLREVDEQEFKEKLSAVREKTGDRAVLRALHFFRDHACAGQEVKALEANDFELFKKLIKRSGASSYQYLQNVYANVDVASQGISVGLAMTEELLGYDAACRVHGGGFAGTIQVFVPNEQVEAYREGIEKVFGEGSCHVLKVRKYGGMKVL